MTVGLPLEQTLISHYMVFHHIVWESEMMMRGQMSSGLPDLDFLMYNMSREKEVPGECCLSTESDLSVRII